MSQKFKKNKKTFGINFEKKLVETVNSEQNKLIFLKY